MSDAGQGEGTPRAEEEKPVYRSCPPELFVDMPWGMIQDPVLRSLFQLRDALENTNRYHTTLGPLYSGQSAQELLDAAGATDSLIEHRVSDLLRNGMALVAEEDRKLGVSWIPLSVEEEEHYAAQIRERKKGQS